MKQVPGDILHHSGVAGEDGLGIHDFPLLWHCTDVPQTDSLQGDGWNERAKVISIYKVD